MNLDDILNDPMFNQTETEKQLFNVSKLPNRKLNTYEARATSNHNHDFSITKELKLAPFNKTILTNTYFVLNGVTGYLKSITDNRCLIYFDNGTESKMLYSSLISMMQNQKVFI